MSVAKTSGSIEDNIIVTRYEVTIPSYDYTIPSYISDIEDEDAGLFCTV